VNQQARLVGLPCANGEWVGFDTRSEEMKLLDYALARLGENSTWRGIALLLTSAGLLKNPEHATAIVSVGLAVVGAINVFRKS
jgi:hypothetical protein